MDATRVGGSFVVEIDSRWCSLTAVKELSILKTLHLARLLQEVRSSKKEEVGFIQIILAPVIMWRQNK